MSVTPLTLDRFDRQILTILWRNKKGGSVTRNWLIELAFLHRPVYAGCVRWKSTA